MKKRLIILFLVFILLFSLSYTAEASFSDDVRWFFGNLFGFDTIGNIPSVEHTLENVKCGVILDLPSGYYKLNNDLIGCKENGFSITGDYLILDCNGYSINGLDKNEGTGIYVYDSDNFHLLNCKIENFMQGVYLENVDFGAISNNVIRNNDLAGIYLLNSDQNEIYSNEIFGHVNYGITLSFGSEGNVIRENSISNSGTGINIFEDYYNSLRENQICGNYYDIVCVHLEDILQEVRQEIEPSKGGFPEFLLNTCDTSINCVARRNEFCSQSCPEEPVEPESPLHLVPHEAKIIVGDQLVFGLQVVFPPKEPNDDTPTTFAIRNLNPIGLERAFIWEIYEGEDYCDMDSQGILTALKEGVCRVKLTEVETGHTDITGDITVMELEVEDDGKLYRIDPPSATIYVEDQFQFGLQSVRPDDGNNILTGSAIRNFDVEEYRRLFDWEVIEGEDYCKINSLGLLTGLKIGTCVIKATEIATGDSAVSDKIFIIEQSDDEDDGGNGGGNGGSGGGGSSDDDNPPSAYACYETWDCGEWSDCINEERTRNCVDVNNCGNSVPRIIKPREIEICVVNDALEDEIDNLEKPFKVDWLLIVLVTVLVALMVIFVLILNSINKIKKKNKFVPVKKPTKKPVKKPKKKL
ncbi:right-handed parallel beta-helix repeat-containing protein [archaeon]|nr:right-handed parallel beta-helix repeat-containing protein [archaeon]